MNRNIKRKKHMTGLITALLGLLSAPLLLTPAYASIIDGSELNISGDGVVGATFLNWLCNQPGDATCPVANNGDFAVASSTGTFAQYNGTFGLTMDINNAAQPLNAPLSLPNFITFDLNNDETIELSFIPLGTDTVSSDCVGLTHCTPQNAALITATNPLGLSSFNLDENSVGTAATFALLGTLNDSSGDTATITGIYTAQFAGLTPAEVLAMLGQPGITSTYSADLVVSDVPEPIAVALVGAGLIGISLIAVRERKRKLWIFGRD